MKTKRWFDKIILAGIWAFLSGACCEAQMPFSWHADLETIQHAAFYKITLTPEWVAKCRQDLADLRIRSGDGKFIPYVLKSGGQASGTGGQASDKYLEGPDPAITQKDSGNRHSYIMLQYGEAYRIDKLDLDIRGPQLYKRRMVIYDNEKDKGRPIAETDIDPASASFRLPPVKTHSLLLDITNADNPPLVIRKVATAQLKLFLLTYLQPGVSYQLLTGNPQAGTPDYDLKYFVDSLTRDPQEILPGPLQSENFAGNKPMPAAEKSHSGIILWGIILLVLLLLISLSLKMVKVTAEKDKHDRL